MQRKFGISCLILFLASVVYCQNGNGGDSPMTYDRKSANLTKGILTGYDHLARPCGKNTDEDEQNCEPIEIKVNMKILSITSVDDDKMHFNMQFLLRQEWNDPRLKHSGTDDLTLDTDEDKNRIWTPDTFFLQEKDGFKSLAEQPNNQYRISPDGDVFFSTRVSITLYCPMDLRRYPFDVQKCGLQFGSYAQTKDHMNYVWNNNRAIELASDVRETTPAFELGDIERKQCKHQWVTGSYSCLKAEIQFKRQFGFADMMKNFIPSFVLVLVSWVAFYLGTEAFGVRALLGAGCLQFLLIHWSILSLNLPHVAGYRAIDIWFVVCIILVALTLVELLIVIRCSPKKNTVSDVEMLVLDTYPSEPPALTKSSRTRVDSYSEPSPRRMSVVKPPRKYTRLMSKETARAVTKETQILPMVPTSQYYEEPELAPKKMSTVSKFRRMSGREKADAVARFLFPLLFIIFNIAYWATYYSC